MEQDELKNTWQEFSKQLSEQPIINKELLNEVVSRRTRGFIRVNIWAIVLLLPLLLYYGWLLRHSWYSVTMYGAMIVIGIPWGLYIMRHLRRAQECSLSIIEREKQLLRFKYLNNIYNYTWVVVFLVWIIIFSIDRWHGSQTVIAAAVAIIAAALLMIVSIRWENGRIRSISEALKRIKNFEKE